MIKKLLLGGIGTTVSAVALLALLPVLAARRARIKAEIKREILAELAAQDKPAKHTRRITKTIRMAAVSNGDVAASILRSLREARAE